MRKTNTLKDNITATELKNHDLICKKKNYSILGLSDPTRVISLIYSFANVDVFLYLHSGTV
jgi:hypothetical protein